MCTVITMIFRSLFPIALLAVIVLQPLCGSDVIPVEAGIPVHGELAPERGARASREFRLTVPADAVSLSISVTDAPVPLEILVRTGSGSILAVHDTGQSGGSLVLQRLGTPALPTGPLLVEISFQARPSDVAQPPTRIPFVLEAELVMIELAEVLRPGQRGQGILEPDRGMVNAFAIDVPATADALRFDVSGAAGTLDLFVFFEELRGDLRTADHRSVSPLGQESILIGGDSGRTILPGRWFVVVTDQTARRFVDSFEVIASFDSDPPRELLGFPDLPLNRGGLQGVLDATVQVVTPRGSGSAVFISETGYLLTNQHVIADFSAGGWGLPVIAVTLDPGVPPRELFRAIVVEEDPVRDLALLRIESGLYGQPVPPGYLFPSIPVASPAGLTFGDTLLFTGYPRFGGRGSRATITVSSGIVAGFELVPDGLVLKTDATIGPGNSGGAAVNSRYELVGLPAEVMGLGSSGIGYIVSTGMIPPRWLALAGATRAD